MNKMPEWSQEKYIHAYHFAARAHRGQLFPGTDLPYIMHISFVSMEVIAALAIKVAALPDLAVQCALLHDVIEDTEVTYQEIKAEFGKGVAIGVRALSKDKNLINLDQLTDSLKRIKTQPQEIWMVKLADRITNLQSPPPHWPKAKIRSNWEGAKEIQSTLKGASPFLEKRLAHKIENYPRYFK